MPVKELVEGNKGLAQAGQVVLVVLEEEVDVGDKEDLAGQLVGTKMVKLQQGLDPEDQMALQGHLGALAGQEVEAKMEEQVAMVEMETMEQLL